MDDHIRLPHELGYVGPIENVATTIDNLLPALCRGIEWSSGHAKHTTHLGERLRAPTIARPISPVGPVTATVRPDRFGEGAAAGILPF